MLRLRELAQADAEPVTGETTVEMLRSTSPRLDVSLDRDPSLILPISDENLAIVLAHLADNAARHGAKGLTIRAEVGPAGPSLSVHDDGDGIAPANRERIFDEFFTTRRPTGGTGMGAPNRALAPRAPRCLDPTVERTRERHHFLYLVRV